MTATNADLQTIDAPALRPMPPKNWSYRGTTPLSEARHLQRIIYSMGQHKDTGPVSLSALARAWCALQDSIRVMRGLPLPGQLRPDLPPMKGAKLRRAKAGQILDIADVSQLMAETREANQAADAQPEVNATAIETRNTPAATATTTPAKKRNPFEKLKRERAAQTKPKSDSDDQDASRQEGMS